LKTFLIIKLDTILVIFRASFRANKSHFPYLFFCQLKHEILYMNVYEKKQIEKSLLMNLFHCRIRVQSEQNYSSCYEDALVEVSEVLKCAFCANPFVGGSECMQSGFS
jgi:hypothetical protein